MTKVYDSWKKLPQYVQKIAELVSALAVIAGATATITSYVSNKLTEQINHRMDIIEKKLSSIELDTTRMQLLELMSDDPDNVSEIMKVAKHYFRDLHGDWYMSGIFRKWAEQHNINTSDIIISD